MSVKRIFAWMVVAFFAFIPLNWVRLWIAGDIPQDATMTSFLIGTAVCWGLAGALAYFLVIYARGVKVRKAREERELQELLNRPLSEIRPRQALIRPDEKAYASAQASLQEVETVGYTSSSFRRNIHITDDFGFIRGHTSSRALKKMVSVASGELVVTDKRVIFAGDRKSFVLALEDLVSINKYSNGFRFSDGKATYAVLTESRNERLIFAVTMDKLLRA